MNPTFYIVLSRTHAEELFRTAPESVIAKIGKHVEVFGAVVVERDGNLLRPHIAENGVQILNRLKL